MTPLLYPAILLHSPRPCGRLCCPGHSRDAHNEYHDRAQKHREYFYHFFMCIFIAKLLLVLFYSLVLSFYFLNNLSFLCKICNQILVMICKIYVRKLMMRLFMPLQGCDIMQMGETCKTYKIY